jgi:hypothetical protein
MLEGPGDFKFTLMDDRKVEVVFFNSSERILEIVSYEELLDAFQKFANKARAILREKVPQLNEHPYWGPWLRGEKD